MPSRRKLNQDFFKRWSPAMAYTLGYFAADGSMICNKRGGHFVEFTTTDRILLKLVRTATGSTHSIQKRIRNNAAWKTQFRLQIGSKTWFDDLSSLGFVERKSAKLHFPDVPREYLTDFVRGYFDGDGCIYFRKLKYADRKRKRWIMLVLFTSGTKTFLETLRDALRPHGVKGGSVRKKNRGYDLSFSHRDGLAIYRFIYHTARTTGLYLPRKYKSFSRSIRTLYPNAAVAQR